MLQLQQHKHQILGILVVRLWHAELQFWLCMRALLGWVGACVVGQASIVMAPLAGGCIVPFFMTVLPSLQSSLSDLESIFKTHIIRTSGIRKQHH